MIFNSKKKSNGREVFFALEEDEAAELAWRMRVQKETLDLAIYEVEEENGEDATWHRRYRDFLQRQLDILEL